MVAMGTGKWVDGWMTGSNSDRQCLAKRNKCGDVWDGIG